MGALGILVVLALVLLPAAVGYGIVRRMRNGQNIQIVKLRAEQALAGGRPDPVDAHELAVELSEAIAKLGAQRDREAEDLLFRLMRAATTSARPA